MHDAARPHLLGFWACVALVVGNTIGAGVFLLPASLAPCGLHSVVAWILTACASVLLAIVFARDSPRHTPTFALLFSSGLVTLLILMNYQESMLSGAVAHRRAGLFLGTRSTHGYGVTW